MELKILTELTNILLYAATNHPFLFIVFELLIKAFWIMLFVYIVLRVCGVGKKKGENNE